MCCLFGMMDYGNNFTGKQKSWMISALAVEAESRGTDATGIAYNSRGRLRVYKRPLPAHRMKFHIPDDTKVVLGHTRLTTQGSEKKNFNNHPFLGSVNGTCFALAHNGVLRNDKTLRKSVKLPETKIETDSYIAVQLIQKKNALDFNSLKAMAEKVEGSFVFTALDNEDTLWFIKGDNPLCIYHYPAMGLYLYASTVPARTSMCMPPRRKSWRGRSSGWELSGRNPTRSFWIAGRFCALTPRGCGRRSSLTTATCSEAGIAGRSVTIGAFGLPKPRWRVGT